MPASAKLVALRERYGLIRPEAFFALDVVEGGDRRITAERSHQAELVRLLLQK